MKTFNDIRDRVIFVDFPQGAHGHFLSKILNGLSSGIKRVDPTDKNYNGLVAFPIKYDCNQLLTTPLFDIPLDCEVSFESGPIFWPMHYGGCILKPPGYAGTKVIEVYVAPSSYFRYFINIWMNTTPDQRSDMQKTEYFVNNFYKIANHMSGGNGRNMVSWFAELNNINNPEIYPYTKEDVLSIIQHSIEADTGRRTRGIRFGVSRATDTCVSIELSEIYSFEKLLDFINRVNEQFSLNLDIDQEYIKQECDHLVAIQLPSSIEFLETKRNLHIIEQAYLNFLNSNK